MKTVQTTLVFVRVEAIPLYKAIAGFTSSLIHHQLSSYPVRQSVSCKHGRW